MTDKFDPITGKVITVFFHYAIPSVIGMLAVTSAGVIDGIFVGNFIGATALAAINISMPVFALFAAVVFMLNVGGSVMCGRFLGEGDQAAASSIFSKTLYASFVLALFISGGILLFLDEVVSLLGANEDLRPLVIDYMTIIVLAAPLLILALTLDYFVRVDGRPILASAALILYGVINIALDWFSPRCSLKLVAVRDGWNSLFRAAYNGFSEFANEMSIGLITLLFNWVMITRLGVEGVAAFTIIGYLLYVGLNFCYGISESLQPTVSKNLGARQAGRIVEFTSIAMIFSLLTGIILCLLFIFLPEFLISLFLREGEEQTVRIALAFIAVFWPAFLFNGMNITLTSYFTALHKPLQSVVIAISRSLVLPALGLLFLPLWLGDTGVYLAIPIAEAMTFLIALLLVFLYRPSDIVRALDAKTANTNPGSGAATG